MADYIDLDYSMEADAYGNVSFKEDSDSVKQAMIDILLTRLGEREMMPTYGSNIFYILFEKMTNFNTIRLQNEIKNALLNWEPRINVRAVDVVAYPDSNYYEATITFNLIRLNTNESLVVRMNRIT
jgi:uncharacterized protein